MLTREKCKTITDRVQKALSGIESELGVKLRVGNGSFGTELTFKVIASPVGNNGEIETTERTDFLRLAAVYGLAPTDLDRQFQYLGTRYTIVGLKPRSSKMPVLAKRGDGRLFKFAAGTVKTHLI